MWASNALGQSHLTAFSIPSCALAQSPAYRPIAGGRGRRVASEAARSRQCGFADGDALLRWRTARDRAGLHGDAGDAGAGWDAHSFSVQPTRLSAPMSQPVPAAGESLPGALPRCVGASAAYRRVVWSSGPLDVPRKNTHARMGDASRWQGCDLMHPLPRRRTCPGVEILRT